MARKKWAIERHQGSRWNLEPGSALVLRQCEVLCRSPVRHPSCHGIFDSTYALYKHIETNHSEDLRLWNVKLEDYTVQGGSGMKIPIADADLIPTTDADLNYDASDDLDQSKVIDARRRAAKLAHRAREEKIVALKAARFELGLEKLPEIEKRQRQFEQNEVLQDLRDACSTSPEPDVEGQTFNEAGRRSMAPEPELKNNKLKEANMQRKLAMDTKAKSDEQKTRAKLANKRQKLKCESQKKAAERMKARLKAEKEANKEAQDSMLRIERTTMSLDAYATMMRNVRRGGLSIEGRLSLISREEE